MEKVPSLERFSSLKDVHGLPTALRELAQASRSGEVERAEVAVIKNELLQPALTRTPSSNALAGSRGLQRAPSMPRMTRQRSGLSRALSSKTLSQGTRPNSATSGRQSTNPRPRSAGRRGSRGRNKPVPPTFDRRVSARGHTGRGSTSSPIPPAPENTLRTTSRSGTRPSEQRRRPITPATPPASASFRTGAGWSAVRNIMLHREGKVGWDIALGRLDQLADLQAKQRQSPLKRVPSALGSSYVTPLEKNIAPPGPPPLPAEPQPETTPRRHSFFGKSSPKATKRENRRRSTGAAQRNMAEFASRCAEDHPLFAYAKKQYWVKKKYLERGDIPWAKLLSHSKKLLAKPLHKAAEGKAEEKDCLQIFKNLVSFMGERSSKHGKEHHVMKLLLLGHKGSALVRAELYCQLAKQTTSNFQEKSNLRAWQLWVLICSMFPPSVTLTHDILMFLTRARMEHAGSAVALHVEAATSALHSTLRNGPRQQVPAYPVVRMIMDLQACGVDVYLPDLSHVVARVYSQTTLADLLQQVGRREFVSGEGPFAELAEEGAELAPIKNILPFRIFQATFIDGVIVDMLPVRQSSRASDLLCEWLDRERAQKIADKLAQKSTKLHFGFMLKPIVALQTVLDDIWTRPGALHILYSQAVADMVDGRFVALEEDSVYQLAALQVQVAKQRGENAAEGPRRKIVLTDESLARVLPAGFLKGKATDDLELARTRVHSAAEEFLDLDIVQAQQAFLKQVQRLPLFGSVSFPVSLCVDALVSDWDRENERLFNQHTNSNQIKFPQRLELAIGAHGLIFLSKTPKKIRRTYSFDTILRFGPLYGTHMFHFVTRSEDGDERIVVLKATQVQWIGSLLHCHHTLAT